MLFRVRSGWCVPAIVAVALVAASDRRAQADPPPDDYPLAVAPITAYDRFLKESFGKHDAIPEAERQFLARVWELRSKKDVPIDDGVFLDAMWFASDAERKKYTERFEQLVAAAKKEVGMTGDAYERGAKLMTFLHKGALKNGYDADQSSVAAVLDTAKYNCVSSAAVYFLVGSRLGLTLRPISIPGTFVSPGHATLDQIVGENSIWVEATNPNGFDWQKKLSEPGVFVLGIQPDRKDGRAVSPWGLPAMIYSNRGVAMKKSGRAGYPTAVRFYLSALALEPSDAGARQNLAATFGNWGPELAKAGQFEEAVAVMAFAQNLIPKANDLATNYAYVWTKFIEHELEAGRDDRAVATARRARKALPTDSDFKLPATWVCRHADRLIKAGGWGKGLEAVERSQKLFTPEEMKTVREWRSSVYRRWSQSRLEQRDVSGSLSALKQAYVHDPNDREILRGIEHHTQEALDLLAAKGALKDVFTHYEELRNAFPGVAEIEETTAAFVHRRIDRLTDAQKFDDALAEADRLKPLLSTPEAQSTAREQVYDTWGRRLAKAGQWRAAVEKYAQGLKACPKSDRLLNNAVATIDEWADVSMKAEKWDEAIAVYRTGLKYFPDDRHLKHNLEYCEKKKGE